MATTSNDLLQGTFELLILRTLQTGRCHGWGILKRIQQISAGEIVVHEGSLYPALYRLEDKGLIVAKTARSETGRKAKFYNLTPKGRRQLKAEIATWKRFTYAVNLILKEA